VRPDASDPVPTFSILAIDPRTVAPAREPSSSEGSASTVITLDPGASDATGASLWWSGASFHLGTDLPASGAVRLAQGSSEPVQGSAVVGVHDESGMLYYAELHGASAGKRVELRAMSDYLARLGCSQRVHLGAPAELVLGDNTTLDGSVRRPPASATAVRFDRASAPRGTRFFESTPVVGRDVWYPMQQHRVRYFKKQD
jgi:hypothetical protein